jgi:hypothetical protein
LNASMPGALRHLSRGRDGTDFLFTPFGHLAAGNPFDTYLPPSEPLADRSPPDPATPRACLSAAARGSTGEPFPRRPKSGA